MSPQAPPPWMNDASPQNWLPVAIAARYYFRRTASSIKRQIRDGTLMRNGVPSYWDGRMWFVRLPIPLKKAYEPPDSVRRRYITKRTTRRRNLLKQYGLRVEDYDAIELQQSGACAICHKTPSSALEVDHDHKTNQIRGLLCGKCNSALGLVDDDPRILQSAILYLKKHANSKMSLDELVQTVNGECDCG